MLTDDELTTLISSRYGDAGLKTPLEDVQRRGDQRTRHSRIALGTAVATVAVVVGGVVAIAGHSANREATPAEALSRNCTDQYHQMITGRNDLADLPTKLPAPVIDLHHGKAEFRLYTTPVTATTKQIVLDCSRTADGQVTANLTASTGTGVSAFIDSDAYYRDYLPDGSGALVGTVVAASTSVTLGGVDGVPVARSGAFFVAWAPTGNLDGATVNVTSTVGGDFTMDEPTTISGTFSAPAFGDACVRQLQAAGSKFVGDFSPAIELAKGNNVDWVYISSDRATLSVCDFVSTDNSRGITVDSATAPAGHQPPYGMGTFVGSGEGFVVGRVPMDVTSVQIIAANGTAYPATVGRGVFGAWVPQSVFAKTSRIVAVSPTQTYTITNMNKVTSVLNQ